MRNPLDLFRRLKPVSEALEIEPGTLGKTIQDAVAAIDRVHRDGVLPKLPVKWAMLTDMYGYFLNRTDGTAVEIAISFLNPHPALTAVHEIGHFLDYKGIGDGNQWASVGDRRLDGWRSAIKSSTAVQHLGHLRQPSVSTVKQPHSDGSVVEYAVDKSYVEYLLKAEELWARSYAQFITVKSGSEELLHQLDRVRDRPVSGLYYGEYWDDPDFVPIMRAIETVLRRMRWLS